MSTLELYQDRILDHWQCPHHKGSCPAPTHAHQDVNALCGDSIRIELAVGPDNLIQDAYFSGEGCCVSQAAASMLVEHLEGLNVAQAREFAATDMLKLFCAPLTPSRQRCCLLAWRVLRQAIAIDSSPVARSQFDPSDGCQNLPR